MLWNIDGENRSVRGEFSCSLIVPVRVVHRVIVGGRVPIPVRRVFSSNLISFWVDSAIDSNIPARCFVSLGLQRLYLGTLYVHPASGFYLCEVFGKNVNLNRDFLDP